MTISHDPFPKLPHAAPFLLLDRVVEIGEKTGTFVKLVAASDPLVAPDGTLAAPFVVEALAQGGAALLAALGADRGTPGYLAGIDDFRAHGVVRIGDTLRVEVRILRQVAGATMFRGQALVEDTLVAEGRFTLALPR